ncbi:Exonuclease SbcC [Streptomyces murinus]
MFDTSRTPRTRPDPDRVAPPPPTRACASGASRAPRVERRSGHPRARSARQGGRTAMPGQRRARSGHTVWPGTLLPPPRRSSYCRSVTGHWRTGGVGQALHSLGSRKQRNVSDDRHREPQRP